MEILAFTQFVLAVYIGSFFFRIKPKHSLNYNSTMASPVHIVLIPFMAQGHLIPIADMTKIFAERGVMVTIITTPLNAKRIKPLVDRALEGSLEVRLVDRLHMPLAEFGLPEGCESMDLVPSRDLFKNFFSALSHLQEPLERLIVGLQPRPTCVIADKNLPWVEAVCEKSQVTRFSFDGTSCFCLLCSNNIRASKVHESVHSESESFLVPGLPDTIEFTAAQLPSDLNKTSYLKELHERGRIAHEKAYGLVVNSFEELELDYLKEYRKLKGDKVWCIGPVSLSHKTDLEKAQRGGGRATEDADKCMGWLDSWPESSVLYVCLGSLGRLSSRQNLELALALEESNQPFIWIMKELDDKQETSQASTSTARSMEVFEERTKGRGLLLKGWAPQLRILSHPAVGAFLTHCGWNSVLEGICAGVPMITWPMFSDQFYNEKEVVEVLKIGEGVGNKIPVLLGDEEKSKVVIGREEIKKAVDTVMGKGAEAEERRNRARRLAEKAKMAMEDGGSSYINVTRLIEHIKQL